MKNKIITSILAVSVIATAILMTSGNNAYAISPYDSGYNHGCDDSDLAPQDRYINEKGKGPSFHTTAFMNGYDAGFIACSNNNNNGQFYEVQTNTAIDDSYNNNDIVSQPQKQSVTTNQIGQCPKMIVNGDCVLGQDQNVENNLGQANRND